MTRTPAEKFAVRGVGAVGGFGSGRADLLNALAASRVKPREITVGLPGGVISLPALLADLSPIERFVPKRQLRRYDRYALLALFAAYLALEDASALEADRGDWGMVVGTGYGSGSTYDFLDSFLQSGDICASPTHFSNSVSNAAAALVAIALGLRGPCLTVSQLDLSFACALQTACGWLQEGRVARVLVGGVDQHLDLVAYSQARLLGAEGTREFHPLGANGSTALFSEGAAFFILSRADTEPAQCCLEGAMLRHLRTTPPAFSMAPLVIGGNGTAESAVHYRDAIPPHLETRCYTPLFGSLPVGPAFDTAAACLCAQEGRLFPSPLAVGQLPQPLEERDLQVLKCAASGHYSLLKVSACAS